MDLLQVAVTAVGAFVALFLLSKLMGHRQISELSVFDYVNGITIGSIAAEMATELEKPLRPLVAMVVWALLVWLLEALTSKCPRLRKYISGAPSIIFDNGKLYRRNMKKARLDLSEFLIQCRQQGFFDLGAIQTAVYEPDGRLTILPVAARRPATPEDMGITPEKEQIFTELILDGRVLGENLHRMGVDETWLLKQLRRQGYHSAREVFLAVADANKQVAVYPEGFREPRNESRRCEPRYLTKSKECAIITSNYLTFLKVRGDPSCSIRSLCARESFCSSRARPG